MVREFIHDDNAVNIELGYILNLLLVIIFTASFTGAFYVRAEHSSQQALYTEFSELGSEIGRDITNMYITSAHSPDNISISMERDIPLLLGGKGYSIILKKATTEGMASVNIRGGNYEISTMLNSIDTHVNASGLVYSGSGEMNIKMIKNNTGAWLWIE
jgi:hypothetical protein